MQWSDRLQCLRCHRPNRPGRPYCRSLRWTNSHRRSRKARGSGPTAQPRSSNEIASDYCRRKSRVGQPHLGTNRLKNKDMYLRERLACRKTKRADLRPVIDETLRRTKLTRWSLRPCARAPRRGDVLPYRVAHADNRAWRDGLSMSAPIRLCRPRASFRGRYAPRHGRS
jgi:hypothetical protein